MVDYTELMRVLSIPRPNGSTAAEETCRALGDWLTRQKIAYRIHTFRLYPYFIEGLGLWIILSSTLLVLSILLRLGWPALLVVGVSLLGITLAGIFTTFGISWPGAGRGKNIVIEFEPPQIEQEIVLSAHYDTKTELLDHKQRAFFTRGLKLSVALALLLGVVGLVDRALLARVSGWTDIAFWAGIGLGSIVLFLAWGLGLNLTLGRLIAPSQGAIDNGAACAILLDVADRLARREISLQRTKVTLALFAGEEVGMQGSRAYVRSRDWPRPAVAINLEIMAQDGDYVIWERDGNVLRSMPTTPALNQAVVSAVMDVTGKPACFIESLTSDGFSFLSAGIPTAVLGTYHSQMGGGGLHRPSDNLARVVMRRLPEGVEVLARLLRRYDAQGDGNPVGTVQPMKENTMTSSQPAPGLMLFKPTKIAGSNPILKQLSRTTISPILLAAVYTVSFLLIRIWAAWRAGHLWTAGNVTGFLQDPALYTNLIIFAIVTYYIWMPRGIAAVFNGLYANGVIGNPCPFPASQEDSQQIYSSFVEKAHNWFSRWWWSVISLVIAVSAALTLNLPQYRTLAQRAAWLADPLSLSLTLLWVALAIYCVSVLLIYAILSIYFLDRLFSRFTICVRPLHPDRAGGLAPLGDFTLTWSYLIAFIGVLLVLTPLTRSYIATGTLQFRWTTEILVALGIYLVAAPSVFLAPLLMAHNAMKETRNQLLSRIAHRFETELREVQDMLDGDLAGLADRQKMLKELQSLHDLALKLPVWPFNSTLFTRFGTSYLSPIALAVVIDLAKGLLNL
jgi:hypothetical protein